MVISELKSALRSFLRQRVFTLVNLIGLAVCFACVLLLGQYLQHETAYDNFHATGERLYRAWIHEDHGEGKSFTNIATPIILAPTLQQNFPEIERAVRIDQVTLPVRVGENSFEEGIHLVDPAFLSSFTFEWAAGNPETAFSDINTIILTPAMAQKYFGREPPLGKSLELRTGDGVENFRVVGLISPPPQASTLQFQALIPFSEHYYGNRATSWFSISVETYLLLQQGVDTVDLEKRINDLMRRVLGPAYPAGHYLVHMQPMTAIHLDTSLPAGMEPLGDPVALSLVASGAVLLLVIGSVNYAAISLGGIARRTREVGLRKTIGARGASILKQFCMEAALLCLLALLLGLALAELYLPIFNELTATRLTLEFNGQLLGLLLMIFLPFVLVVGSFPALMVLRFRPSRLLNDRLTFDSDKSVVMRGLIVFQFALAITMLVSSVAVVLQMRYVDSKDLGFDAGNLLVVPLPGSVGEGKQLAERFMAESDKLAFIEGISYASAAPGEGGIQWSYTDDGQVFRQFDVYEVGPDFLSLMGMELVEGRPFRDDSPRDAQRALIVNEAFLRDYGWKDGVGKRLPGRDFPAHDIIGVIRDANFRTLTDEIRPMAFALSIESFSRGISDSVAFSSPTPDLLIRLEDSAAATALPVLEDLWKRIHAGVVFEPYWLEDALARQYRQQANFRDIVQSATFIAVFVAAMGLFALAVLMTHRRRKEIGIRKVMGGGVWRIVLLLTNEFSKLVLISNLIAWPAAWFAMNRWLENFAYRIDLTPLIFIGSGLSAFCIAWVTVGGTAARAASQKSVLALRDE